MKKPSMPAGAGIGGHRYLVHESEIIPIGQNYLENSQWFNIDLSLSEQGEGTYLEGKGTGIKAGTCTIDTQVVQDWVLTMWKLAHHPKLW